MANPIQIHFKSLAGEIFTLALDHPYTMSTVRHLLAQQLSTHEQINYDRIVIFDPAQDDPTVQPDLQPDATYPFIVRDSDANTFRVLVEYDDPVTNPLNHILYEKHTFKIFDIASQDTLVDSFSVYYDPVNEWFIPSRFFTESKEQDGTGQPNFLHPDEENHFPVMWDAIHSSLSLPWYDRFSVTEIAFDSWSDSQANHFNYDPYDHDDDNEHWDRHHELMAYMDAYGPYDHGDEF
jgi:hypothetical protein